MAEYYVYIVANRSRTLYIGVTNDLVRRVFEHKQKLVEGFTQKYKIDQLVYYETTKGSLKNNIFNFVIPAKAGIYAPIIGSPPTRG